jgi:hypothetical protein
MNKTISINPNLFKISSEKKTRKRKEKSEEGNNIKVREPAKDKRKQQGLRRNHVLRFIREQQEKNYKRLIEGDDVNKVVSNAVNTNDFDSDFDGSLKYLASLENTPHVHSLASSNHTLRNRVSTNENVSLDFPDETKIELHDNNDSHITLNPKGDRPSWGCLKNGDLPTYRNWKNVTQRALPYEKLNEIQSIAKHVVPKKKQKMHYPKQKRTVRRTYSVGRCKSKPIVGVLVSNRTIRNKTTTKTQLMKQTPIEEVRRYLVKKGFIKVGSIAPNDVLRKMYETVSLICGEVENHNPDNLLYNYFHDTNQ